MKEQIDHLTEDRINDLKSHLIESKSELFIATMWFTFFGALIIAGLFGPSRWPFIASGLCAIITFLSLFFRELLFKDDCID